MQTGHSEISGIRPITRKRERKASQDTIDKVWVPQNKNPTAAGWSTHTVACNMGYQQLL